MNGLAMKKHADNHNASVIDLKPRVDTASWNEVNTPAVQLRAAEGKIDNIVTLENMQYLEEALNRVKKDNDELLGDIHVMIELELNHTIHVIELQKVIKIITEERDAAREENDQLREKQESATQQVVDGRVREIEQSARRQLKRLSTSKLRLEKQAEEQESDVEALEVHHSRLLREKDALSQLVVRQRVALKKCTCQDGRATDGGGSSVTSDFSGPSMQGLKRIIRVCSFNRFKSTRTPLSSENQATPRRPAHRRTRSIDDGSEMHQNWAPPPGLRVPRKEAPEKNIFLQELAGFSLDSL
jgi:hypothetical protein